MKNKTILSTLLASLLTLSALAQTQEEMATLKDLGEAKLSDPNSTSLIIFGDPQTYTQFAINHPILDMMAEWVVSKRKTLNIKGILCTGDLVQYNGILTEKPHICDQTNIQMWEAVKRAFDKFNNLIPYIVTTGNHDYGYKWAETEQTFFPKYFNASNSRINREMLIATAPNRAGLHTLENSAHLLEIGGKWDKLLVITLEFKPRKEVLVWAKSILDQKEYANTRAVILTHHFLNTNATISKKKGYKMAGVSAQEIWDELISKCPNVVMTVSGHVTSTTFKESSVCATFTNDAGGKVFSMMFNPQKLGGGYTGNGGDGWIRILELLPDGETIKASTYSPLFGISPLTRNISWRTGPSDMFEFKLPKPTQKPNSAQ